jgi:hypothetical protein
LQDASPAGSRLYDNPKLTELTGLEGLIALRGLDADEDLPYWITAFIGVSGLGIQDLTGLDKLRLVGTDHFESFWVSSNPELTSLKGLEALEYASSLSLASNPKLTDLQALESLMTLGSLRIADNDALVHLSGLESLTSVWKYSVEITDNQELASLDGLYNLTEIAGTLWIKRNCALTDEDAYALAAHIVNAGGTIGELEIEHNGPLCDE